MSHSSGLAVYALSSTHPIGIDIEYIDRSIRIEDLTQMVLNRDEYLRFLNTPLQFRREMFYDFWVKKESVLKASEYGLTMEPKQVDIGSSTATLAEDTESYKQAFQIFELEAPPSYTAAVAVQTSLTREISIKYCNLGHVLNTTLFRNFEF